MTDKAKRTVALSVLLTLLGALIVPLLTAAWNSKVSSSDFQLYAQDVNGRIDRLSRTDSIQRELMVDILCTVKKQNDRRCKAP
jgi:hypothetical protein